MSNTLRSSMILSSSHSKAHSARELESFGDEQYEEHEENEH